MGQTHRVGATVGTQQKKPIRVAMIAFAANHHTTRWSRALAATGLDVHVIGVAGSDGVPLVTREQRTPGRAIPVLSAASDWWSAIAECKPDVVYMQWLFARPAMLLALDPAWPLVTTVMGSDVRQDPSLHESMLERTWRTALLLRAERITAVAGPLADVVAKYHPDLAAKTEIVPFGVDTQQFHPPKGAVRRLPQQPLVVGHFKSDDVVYGRLDLLRALTLVQAEGQEIVLHLAGRRGNDGGAVTRYLRDHPHLAACVVDHGLLNVDDIAQLYRQLDVYVMNSLQESFGVAAAEALATGVPVIASAVGGVRCLVRSGDTGILIPPADPLALSRALLEFAHFPELAESCGQRGRARVQSRFEWNVTVARMAELIREAAASGSANAHPLAA